ncbi:MAG: hypothetical protein RMJ88_15505, partial [Thermogemmata sp.]|nr:hypothetical protein [Thermogemmata sp.]
MQQLPSKGEYVNIMPFDESAEVIEVQQRGNYIRLGVVFLRSRRCERFVFSLEELGQRVQRLPGLWDDFVNQVLPRESFIAFTDALRMHLAYSFDPHYAVSVTQVDLLPHQVDAVYKHILPQPRIRFLLADDPGLGKTVMAGLVLKELKARGLFHTTLLIVPAHSGTRPGTSGPWKRVKI